MNEPAFLKDIHEAHLREYKKHKGKTLDERLKLIQKKANQFAKKHEVITA